jgi:dsRNA-specific ribonuclease
MTCYNEKTRKIFENLEILGGVTCNLIIGILVFLEETVKFEGKNVEKIVKALLGVENCEKVAKKFDLFYFLKTSCIKPTCFRPAFYASKESITECYNLEHRISEGLAAGFIKALVAGLLVSNGLKDSAELLVKFGILKENQFRIVEKYLNDDSLFLVNCKKISSLSIIPKFSEIFYGVQKNTVENILDYQFNDQTLLEKSECLDLFNQKIVKFLGKAIIDFIVSYNFLTFLDLETSLFLFLFQEARSSYNISRITLSSGLFKFINLETDKKLNLENIFQEKSWDDHLFKTSSPLPVCLENFFYNLSVAILKDSEDLSMTCQLIGFFFNDFISVSLRYKNRLKKALNSKITEILKNTSVKVEYKEIENSSGACVKVFINKELVCESTGRNIKQAKVEACLNVFQFICMCNLIHYNKPLLVMD